MSSVRKIASAILPKSLKRILRNPNKGMEDLFFRGYNDFLKTGSTPHESFVAMVDLYAATNGEFIDSVNKKIRKLNPASSVPSVIDGIIGSYSARDFDVVNNELNRDGYSHFEKRLSPEFCKKLYDFAMRTPATVPPDYKDKILYDPAKPVAGVYRLDRQDIINNPEVQELVMDPVLINIARNYLECEPIFDYPAMWWSPAFSKEASGEAAQLYHFDLDRIKWLKLFIYVNDVTPENGPHCYIKGSHRAGNKPAELLKRGYARIPDSDLKTHYKETDFVMACAPAGSIFAGDTKCWHKSNHVSKGHRLVLEFEYTGSMFGANYPKLKIKKAASKLAGFSKMNKVYCSNMFFDN